MINKIIKKALVSVSDKSNLKILADFLYRNQIEVLSTGGTYKELKKLTPKLKLLKYLIILDLRKYLMVE